MKTMPNGRVPISEENFPDEYFREFIMKNISKGAKSLSFEKIEKVEAINLLGKKEPNIVSANNRIKSLEGIEIFQNLKTFEWEPGRLLAVISRNENDVTLLRSGREVKMSELLKEEKDIKSLEKIKGLNELNINGLHVQSSLDFSQLPNLERLQARLSVGLGDTLDFSGNDALKSLDCSSTGTEEIIFPQDSKLQVLDASNTVIKNIDLNRVPDIRSMFLEFTHIRSLDLRNNKNLRVLRADKSHHLKEVLVPEAPNLFRVLKLDETGVEKLCLDGCANLETVFVMDSNLREISLKGCVALNDLRIPWNNLKELDISDSPNIYNLSISGNRIEKIDVSLCKDLTYFFCEENPIQKLDLRKNINLETLLFGQCKIKEILCSDSIWEKICSNAE